MINGSFQMRQTLLLFIASYNVIAFVSLVTGHTVKQKFLIFYKNISSKIEVNYRLTLSKPISRILKYKKKIVMTTRLIFYPSFTKLKFRIIPKWLVSVRFLYEMLTTQYPYIAKFKFELHITFRISQKERKFAIN